MSIGRQEFPGTWTCQGHLAYLHRYGALRTTFRDMPAWLITPNGGTVANGWLRRTEDTVGRDGDFAGLGRWPRRGWWQRTRERARVAIRPPGIIEVQVPKYTTYAWTMPVDPAHYLKLQVYVVTGAFRRRLKYVFKYRLYGWYLNKQFASQDEWMVKLMRMSGPERLYRPDSSITAWRRLCESARPSEKATVRECHAS